MRKNRFFAIALALMMLLQAAPINAFAALGGESAPAVETVEEAPLVTVEAETKDAEPAPAEKKEEKDEEAIPVEFDYGTLHVEVVGPDGEPLNGTLGLRDEDGRGALVATVSSFELDVIGITKWSPAMRRFTEVAEDGDTCSVYLYEETAKIKGAGKESKAKTVYTPLDLPLELVCTCEYEEVTDETGAVTKLVRHFTLAPADKSLLDDDGTLIVRYAELETQFVDLPVEVVDENDELLEGALFWLCDDDGTDPDAGKPAVFAAWDAPQFEILAATFDKMVGRPWENGESISLYLWETGVPDFYDGLTETLEIVCTYTEETEENDDGVVTKIVRRLALSCAAAEDGVLRIRHTPNDDARLNIIFHTEEQKPRIENTWSIMMVIEGPNGYHRTLFDLKAVTDEQPTEFDTTLYPLEPGEYTITVLGAETPHVNWETTTFTFTVEPGENEYEIVLTRDESLPRYEDALTVYKVENIASEMAKEGNIKLLPGAEFGLYTSDGPKTGKIGELIATYVTDENGRLVIRTDDAALKDYLPDPWREGERWYVLREDKAPAGYLNTGLEYDVIIRSNGDGLYTIVYGVQRTTQVTPVKLGETAGTQAGTAVKPIFIEANDHVLRIRNLPAEENVGNLRLNVSITFPADVTINGLHEDRRVEKIRILIDGPAGYGRKIVELNWDDFTKAEDANVYTYSGLLEGVPAGDYLIDADALEVPGFSRTIEVTCEPENPRGGTYVNEGETATVTADIEYVKDVKSTRYYGLDTVIFDAQTGEGLGGSEFTIYDAEGSELGTYTTKDDEHAGTYFIPCDPNDENTPQWVLDAFNALDLDSGRREFYVGPFTLKQTKALEGYLPSVKEYQIYLQLNVEYVFGGGFGPRPIKEAALAADAGSGLELNAGVKEEKEKESGWVFTYRIIWAEGLELDENGDPTSPDYFFDTVLEIPNTRADSVGQLQIVKRVRVSDDRSGKVTFPGAPEGMTFTVTGPETFAPVTLTLADFGEPVEKQDMGTVIDLETGEEVEVPMGEPYLEYTYTLEVPYGRYYVTEDPESAQVEGYILYTGIGYSRAVIKDDGVGKKDAGTAAEVKGGLDFSKDDGAGQPAATGIFVDERNDGPSYAYVDNDYYYEIRYNTLPVRKIDGSTDKLVILPGAVFGLYTGEYVIDPETGKETFVQGELIKTYVSDERGFFIIDTADPDLAPYLPSELFTGDKGDENGHVTLYLIEITAPEGYLPSTMVYPVDIWFRKPRELKEENEVIREAAKVAALDDGAVLMGAPQTETKVTPQPGVPPEEEATKEAPFKYEYRIDSPYRRLEGYLDVPNTPDAWGSLKLVKTVRILDNKTQQTGTAIPNDRISQITEHLGETRFNISGPDAFGEKGWKIVTLAEFGEPAMSTETLSDGRVVTVYTFTKTLSVPVGEYHVYEEYAPAAPAVTRVTSISYGEPVVNNPQAVGGGAALQSVNGEVAETRATAGHIVIEDFARVVKFGTTQVNIENTYTNRLHEIRYEGMTVNKVDADNGKVLPGATFAIYDADGNEVHRFVSGEEPYVIDPQAEWLAPYLPNRVFNPEGLYLADGPDPGYVTFTVKELEAPEGYIKSEMEYTLTLMLTMNGWYEPAVEAGSGGRRSLEPVAETKAEKEIGDLTPIGPDIIKVYDWYDLVYRIYYGLPRGIANNSLTVGNTQIGKEAANGKLILTKRIRVVGDEEMQAFPATPPDIVFTVSGGPNYFADVTVKLSDFEGPATVTEVIEAMSGRPREEITYEVYTLELEVPVGEYTVTEDRASAQVPGFQLYVAYDAFSPEDELVPENPDPGAMDTLKSAVKALTGNVAAITAGTLAAKGGVEDEIDPGPGHEDEIDPGPGHDVEIDDSIRPEPAILIDGIGVRVTDITDEEDALIPSRVIITDTYTNRIDEVNHSAVTVNKVDENGDDLTGATFTLYYGDTAIMTFQGGEFEISTALEQLKDYLPTVAGEDGVVELTLKETAAPEGYVLSEKEYPIFIRLDTVVEYERVSGDHIRRSLKAAGDTLKTLFGNVAALTSGTLASAAIEPKPIEIIERWTFTYAIWTLDEAGEQTQELEIANEPVPTEPRYGLIVRWTAEGADIPENAFVTVTGPDGFEQKIYYSEFDGDEYRLQLPAGVYTVTENEPSAQVENYELTVTVKPAASVELGAAKGEEAQAEATDPEIHVHNVYQRLYELVITLTGVGADIPENAYVTVTGPDGFEQIIYYYEFDETGTYTLEVPAGEYFVTENRPSAKVNGHSLTISGDNGTPVTVGENGGRADIKNEYKKNSGGDDPTPRPDPVEPTNPPTPVLNTDDHYAYIIGYPDGTVRPEGTITRAETVTIFFRMLTDESRAAVWSTTNPFTDVKAADWFNNAISTMSNAGIVNGYPDGSFNPNGNITRAEFAAMAIRFFQDAKVGPSRFSDTIGHWAEEAINKAQAQGLITGYPDGTFRPDEPITRAEAMTIMNRVLKRAPHKDHLLSERYMITFTDNMDTTKWYYADVQEATNSHTYRMSGGYEDWEEILPIRDWAAFETMWSNANSAKNPGEVIGD